MRSTKSGLIAILAIGLLAGSAVGVVAQEEPVEVTGEVRFSGSSGSVETWTTNDPRLSGTGTWDPTGFTTQAPGYFLNGRFLETDEGTWRQLPVAHVFIPGEESIPVWDMVLVGEGGYEGLVFVARATWVSGFGSPGFDVHGYIVGTAAP